MGLWFSKIYHHNRCIITSDAHSLRSDPELLFTAWAYPWKIDKIPFSMGCRVVLEHFSLIFTGLSSFFGNWRKRKFVERKPQKCQALACLAIIRCTIHPACTWFVWPFHSPLHIWRLHSKSAAPSCSPVECEQVWPESPPVRPIDATLAKQQQQVMFRHWHWLPLGKLAFPVHVLCSEARPI